jgi:hypothetical protein
VALGFIRFVGESRPSRWVELVETSRRYPTPLHFGGFPGKVRQGFPLTGMISHSATLRGRTPAIVPLLAAHVMIWQVYWLWIPADD